MTTIKNTKEIPQNDIAFSGALDSSPFTINGDVMRLFVRNCNAIKKGNKEKVKVKILELDRYFNEDGKKVDEGSSDDTIGEFQGFLENKDENFFFSEMKPVSEINWVETAPYPYFRIGFAGENDNVTNKSDNETTAETFPVVIGKDDEPPESPEFEIGFMIEKEDGTFLGGSGNLVTYFSGTYYYKPFLDMYDIRTQLDSVNLLNITNAQVKYAASEGNYNDELNQAVVASTTQVYDNSLSAYNGKKMKQVEAALKKIDTLIKSSKNPYFQNIQAANEYYQKLELYKGTVEQYQEMQKNNKYSNGDCYTLENTSIRPLVQELNKLEDDIHEYLKMSGKPPKVYMDRIEKNIAIITRNKNIDEILNNPAVQIMGLLPGAGVVTGTLKLIKGDIFDGFLDVFGSIITYGSFLKLSRVARAYRKASKSTVEMLYSYRYRKLVSSITSADVMEKITETSLKHSGTFFGNLFDTVGTFKSLKGHVDSIALLHNNKKYIIDMTEIAIKGIQGGVIENTSQYLKFLEDLANANATAEFFAHLRLLHATVKGGKDAYTVTLEAMEDVNKLLRYKDIPGVKDFDTAIVNNTQRLFSLMAEKEFKIDQILKETTAKFPSDSSIIDYFNKVLAQYDMFGVNRNADVRYQNTRAEMLLALDEIVDRWGVEKQDRDDWINKNKAKFIHSYQRELQIQWARTTKSSLGANLPESLETRIENFIQKLKGQIEAVEAIEGKSELTFLESTVSDGFVPGTKVIFDFDVEFFKSHGENLVKKFY